MKSSVIKDIPVQSANIYRMYTDIIITIIRFYFTKEHIMHFFSVVLNNDNFIWQCANKF